MIYYSIYVDGKSIRRTKRRAQIEEAEIVKAEIKHMSTATKTQIASAAEIDGWIEKKYLTPEQATKIFRSYTPPV